MLKKYHWTFLVASLGGFLTFYFLFSAFMAIFLMMSEPRTTHIIPIIVTFVTFEGLSQFPLAVSVGFPLFLLGLTICNRLTQHVYLSVVCHALLAVPLSGLVLASADWGGLGIVQDWHEIVQLAARWLVASLPSGAIGGFTSWALRPPLPRDKIQVPV